MNSVWRTIVTSLANYWKENCPDVFPELIHLHNCLEVKEQDIEFLVTWENLVELINGEFPAVELKKDQFEETDRTLLGLLLLIDYSKKISSSSVEGLCTLSRNSRGAVTNFLRSFSDISNENITREAVLVETCKRSCSPRKRRRRGRKGDKSAHSVQSSNGKGSLSGDDMFGDGASDNNDGMEQSAEEDNNKQLKDTIKNLKETITELENEKMSFVSILEGKNNQLKKQFEEQSNEYKQKLEEAEKLVKEKCCLVEEYQSEISTIKSKLSKELSNKEEIEKDLSEKSQHIANLEAKVATLSQDKKLMTGKYHDKLQESVLNRNKLEDSLCNSSDLKIKLEKALQEKEDLYKVLSEKDKEIGALHTRFENVNKDKESADVDVVLKEKYIHRMEEQVRNLEALNDSLQLELKNLKNDYGVCSEELSESKRQMAELEERNKTNCVMVENLELELKLLADKWQQATRELDKLTCVESATRNEIETLRFYNDQLMKSNDISNIHLSEKNILISRLTDRCEELSRDVMVLKTNFETKTKEILVLDRAFIDKKKELDGMRDMVKELEGKLETKNEELSKTRLAIKETDRELANLKVKYETALKDLNKSEFSNSEKGSCNEEVKLSEKRKDSFETLYENQTSLTRMCTNDCLALLEENDDMKENKAELETRVKELEVNNHSISLINSKLKDEVDKVTNERDALVNLVSTLRLELEAKTKKKKKKSKISEQSQTVQEDNLECTAKKSKKFTMTSWPVFGGLFSSQKSKSSINSKEKLDGASTSAQNGDTLTPTESPQKDADCRELNNVYSRVILESKLSQVCFEFLSLSYLLFSLLCSTSVILVSKVANPLNYLFKALHSPPPEPNSENNGCDETNKPADSMPAEVPPPITVNECDTV